jgi:mono/diheme cytochrome c family protein
MAVQFSREVPMYKTARWWSPVLFIFALLISVGPAKAQLPAGEAARGEALYVGTASFEKSGSPCLACHSIAGAGLGKAAGASYGPDLTELWESFGEEGVAAVLESVDAFPSMSAIYASRPLNLQEQADLAAFLQQVSGREAPRIAGSLLLEAGAGIGVAFLVLAIFGRNRLKSERPCPCSHYPK